VEWDGQLDIAEGLEVTVRTYRTWKKLGREIEELPILATDQLHDEGREFMNPCSGHWWKEEYTAWKKNERSKRVKLRGKHSADITASYPENPAGCDPV
jgi:hypothetical protein